MFVILAWGNGKKHGYDRDPFPRSSSHVLWPNGDVFVVFFSGLTLYFAPRCVRSFAFQTKKVSQFLGQKNKKPLLALETQSAFLGEPGGVGIGNIW